MAEVVYGESFASHQSFTAASFYSEFTLDLPLEGSNMKCLSGLKKYHKISTTEDYRTNRSCGTQKPDFVHICTCVM